MVKMIKLFRHNSFHLLSHLKRGSACRHSCLPVNSYGLKYPRFVFREITFTPIQRLADKQKDDRVPDKIITIPNILCLGRITASPLLSYYIINLDFHTSLGILVVASLTDLMDGWIARKFQNQSSKLGSFLDPLADKILVITLYGSLAYAHIIPDFLMGLIIVRDIALLSAGFYIRYLSITPPRTLKKYFDYKHSSAQLSPTTLSKINTTVQLITATASLYGAATSSIPEQYLVILWYLAGITTITSGISYIFAKNTYVIFKQKK